MLISRNDSIFDLNNQQILLVSKHKKEQVIEPVFLKEFNASIIVASNIDTDEFGMFSGEVQRTLSAKETVYEKCQAGLNANPTYRFAIASEGSFGAHPSSPFLPFNEEWLVFIDKLTSIVIYSKSGTSDTNYFSQEISQLERLDLLEKTLKGTCFILKNTDGKILIKGTASFEIIKEIGTEEIKKSGSITVETDLRAMNNPLRMQYIGKAAEKLAEKLKSNCPKCEQIGFSIEKSIPGLPCEICEFPSSYPKNDIKVCLSCGFEEIVAPRHQQVDLEQQYCQICNP